MVEYVVPFSQLGMDDVGRVGGKNASLGEMISNLASAGVQVPDGFATTAEAFREFLSVNQLDTKIEQLLHTIVESDLSTLAQAGSKIRALILHAPFSSAFEAAIRSSYAALMAELKTSVAVRSSATAEDLPDASFAGQQETILNVEGIENVLHSIKVVFASLYNDRAISYRAHQNYAHHGVAISAGIQRMVRSDLACSGVMFSIDTESGFKECVFITGSYGLGELVVQGAINPDEYYVYKTGVREKKPAVLRRTLGHKQQKMVFGTNGKMVETLPVSSKEAQKFCLTDAELTVLATHAMNIEKHYKQAMDIEWAKDGISGQLFIVQARPETVKSNEKKNVLERYTLEKRGKVLAEGRSIGQRIGSGRARLLTSHTQMQLLQPGDVLVTDMTDPDWEPIMKKASAIVTNRGGRTCHAAIIARELGIPAVVGCSDATDTIKDGTNITVSCAEGDVGYVYEGLLKFELKRIELENMPALPFKMMMNVGNPDRAFTFCQLPNNGVGLARLEFIISQMIGIHPKACLAYPAVPAEIKAQMEPKIAAYGSATNFYVQKLAEGISTIAAAFAGKPVIIRMSDFKSNEYRNLIGGALFEPIEENPMIGYRGASRYVSQSFAESFALECAAVKYVREEMGLMNVQIMIPFVRSVAEGKAVLDLLAQHGLKRGDKGLQVQMMCEVPTNALLAEQYLEHFDGFSIGSNDLTQLTLGLDRDSGIVAHLFDERDAAVKTLLDMAISACLKKGKYIGICGQGPSDHPDFAAWLVHKKIGSMSLNPDSIIASWLALAKEHGEG